MKKNGKCDDRNKIDHFNKPQKNKNKTKTRKYVFFEQCVYELFL